MTNKKPLGKILAITGMIMILTGFGLTQLHIPLSKEESENLFRNCIECKYPPTYRTLDSTLTEGLFFAGFPVVALGVIFRYQKAALHPRFSQVRTSTWIKVRYFKRVQILNILHY